MRLNPDNKSAKSFFEHMGFRQEVNLNDGVIEMIIEC